MNRKGFGMFGFIILYLFLIIMWALFLGSFFSLAGDQAVAAGATGLEAFFWTNINLWFFLVMIVVGIVYFRFGGDQ